MAAVEKTIIDIRPRKFLLTLMWLGLSQGAV